MIDPSAYIFLLPVAVIIAVLAMSAGISGSNFWIPVYYVWLGIDPLVSFWLALITMLFGFGSGTIRNIMSRTVNWVLVRKYLVIVVPSAILGTLLVPFVPAAFLLGLFGGFVILYGIFLIYRFGVCRGRSGPGSPGTADRVSWELGVLAGLLKGLIATGTGIILMPCLMGHCRVRSPAEAVGTTVVIIFIVNIFAAVFRLTPGFLSALPEQGDLIVSIMIWVAPGVIIGGQAGPRIARGLSVRGIRIYVGILLVFVGLLIYLRMMAGF